ncbi:hypothetical protein [Acidisoma silvae]|uniref:Calcium-binding protein n=1 Tax=Acidisoma silvae TaxID=2802396 RepID=A0A963YRS3_9PROT|nr:hypothetical protein [Acidisoma silvae]MCB8875782.1 hypothetical protein [Acidisoma silvae]
MSDIMTVNGGSIPSNFSAGFAQTAFLSFFNPSTIVTQISGAGSFVVNDGTFPSPTAIMASEVAVTLSGANAIAITGASDTVTAGGSSPYQAFLNGGGSNVLNTGSGQSTVFASSGSATINAGAGSTTVEGSSGSLAFNGGSSSNDLVFAGSGFASMDGGSGGNDTLVGGSFATFINLSGASQDDFAVAGTGITVIDASQTTGGLTISTNPSGVGVLSAIMGSGADTFVGGGTTHTVVQGGSGADVFLFLSNGLPGADTILGFSAKDNIGFEPGLTIKGEAVGTMGDVITLSDGTTITLSGVDHKLFS